jgi:hypothetical protein
MRHKKVEQCCVGGLAFYLAMCFHMTREFEEFTLHDWLDNSKWFDVKLLFDATKLGQIFAKRCSMMLMQRVLRKYLWELGVASNHWVHLGRITCPQVFRDAGGGGGRYSNFGELESNDARTMIQYQATNEANSGNCWVFRV